MEVSSNGANLPHLSGKGGEKAMFLVGTNIVYNINMNKF
jgi:hypothetical protein